VSKNNILEQFPEYRMDIGIEVHVQLNTKSKIFCSCSNGLTDKQNHHICPVCAGYPGVLPVLNEQVITYAIMAGLGTNCTIAPISEFDRKHYFYPDLPKNYQITQNDRPICENGSVMIRLEDGSEKKIRIRRIHIEEDAGKNIHSDIANESYVDLNRTGTPLLEIVTEPDIENAEEAKAYLKALRAIMQYLKVSECNMEEGSFRADTNLSVRKKTSTELGTRCELKNINSFKFISDAIEYEVERQIKMVECGEKVIQETRLWDSKNKKSLSMRSKENLADYRYCTDPDLSLIEVSDETICKIREQMPELPYAKYHRYIKEFGLSDYEANIIVAEFELAHYFDQLMLLSKSKTAVNLLLRDVLGWIKESKISINNCLITPDILAQIAQLLDEGVVNNQGARIIFETIAQHGGEPMAIVETKGLKQIASIDELEKIVKQVLADNSDAIEKYKTGKGNTLGFFVGACMKATQGKGNPKLFQDILSRLLC
jgi:aspartyl-tRNA(Asn)/glutamyl-tRNA(Gln) amidotransferase subunit B